MLVVVYVTQNIIIMIAVIIVLLNFIGGKKMAWKKGSYVYVTGKYWSKNRRYAKKRKRYYKSELGM